MNPEFEVCLKRGKIKEFSQGRSLTQKEIKTAESDLNEAKRTFQKEGYKWATIQAYYSMFHSARALLYNKNYREKSHYCLIVALKVLYVETGLLPVSFVDLLQRAKGLREDADYYDEWSKITTEDILTKAEEFLEKAEKIIAAIDI
jgi:uncharacterized protein (UPF0332 family)